MKQPEIITVCMHCGSIKDWEGEFNRNMVIPKDMQEYVPHGAYSLSHSVCDDCLEEHYPEAYKRIREKNNV